MSAFNDPSLEAMQMQALEEQAKKLVWLARDYGYSIRILDGEVTITQKGEKQNG